MYPLSDGLQQAWHGRGGEMIPGGGGRSEDDILGSVRGAGLRSGAQLSRKDLILKQQC